MTIGLATKAAQGTSTLNISKSLQLPEYKIDPDKLEKMKQLRDKFEGMVIRSPCYAVTHSLHSVNSAKIYI